MPNAASCMAGLRRSCRPMECRSPRRRPAGEGSRVCIRVFARNEAGKWSVAGAGTPFAPLDLYDNFSVLSGKEAASLLQEARAAVKSPKPPAHGCQQRVRIELVAGPDVVEERAKVGVGLFLPLETLA